MSRNFESDSELSDADYCPDINENEISEEEENSNIELSENEKEEKESGKGIKRKQKEISKNEKVQKIEGSHPEECELESHEEERKRTNELWKDFLSDVKTSSSAENVSSPDNSKLRQSAVGNAEDKKNFNSANSQGTPKLTRGAIVSANISSLLSSGKKHKKSSVLDSSFEDWKTFKEHEGLQVEIEEHNRGKRGYLDRQDFLQRTDLRQFEIEKNLRRTRNKP